MDEYIDSFLSSSLWADEDVKEELTWSYREADQSNMTLPSSFTFNENDRGSFPSSIFSSKFPAQDFSSIAPGIETNVAFENFGEVQLDSKGGICADEISPMMNDGGLKMENMSLPYDTTLQAFDPLNIRYPKQISGLEDLSFTEGGNVGGFCEQFSYNRSFTDLQNLSSMQQTWPSSSCRGVTPVLTAMGQETAGQFGIREGNLDDESSSVLKRNVSMGHIVLEKSASIATEEKEEFRSYPVSSLTDVSSRRTTNGVSFQSQTSSAGGSGVCNRTGKARVRARRGQATDPHSIAERLRREKIAERMKNLQELVPKSTKADKASMLDDIIEYVKFLQLQVKVLSMSRLGAAEAVIPLITHGQTEACNDLLLSTSTEAGNHMSASPEQIAFEEEVLKLMESNMTMAIQHLQSKGLCLMPIALANAISTDKAKRSSNGFEDREKIGFAEDNIVEAKSNSNSSSSSCSFSGDVQRFYDGNIAAQQLGSEDVKGNVKIENGRDDSSIEIKPKPVI